MVTPSDNFPDTQYVGLLVGKRKRIADRSEPLKVVKRVLKLFILCFVLPIMLLIYPMYLRNRVYTRQDIPMGISDMLTIDNKISTTWCQRQVIRANTSYNAYVIANEPQISLRHEKVDMTRRMLLKDGAKEYWGFYLLRGSTFTISSCVRWPGASLIVIEGHKNLKECAYVGDNSSEENDDDVSSDENRNVSVTSQMTKIVPGVVLNVTLMESSKYNNSETLTNNLNSKVPKTGAKAKNVHLQYAEDLYWKEQRGNANRPETLKRESNKPSSTDSAEVLDDVVNKLKGLGSRGKQILQKLKNQTDDGNDTGSSEDILNVLDELIKDAYGKTAASKSGKRSKINETRIDDEKENFQKLHDEIMLHRLRVGLVDREANTGQEVFYEADKADIHAAIKQAKADDRSKSEYWSSVSSSEERLLECKGLLVSLPLIPQQACQPNHDNKTLESSSAANSISYTIQSDGYYFFIFNNENEVEKNFIYAHFNIVKTLFNISNAVVTCRNTTNECSLPLSFWSRERTILEKQKPYPMNDDSWNEEFIISTQCEPRSILYVICLMCMLLGILLFALS